MPTILATVTAVTGKVFAVNATGTSRPLVAGDALLLGETVVTQAGGHADLMMVDGQALSVEPAQSLKLSADITATTVPDKQDSQIADGTVQSVIKALNTGGNLDALEATAAGLGGGTGGQNDGSNFVRLLRITEGVSPLVFDSTTPAQDINFALEAGNNLASPVLASPAVAASPAPAVTTTAPTIASVTPASAQEGNTLVFNVTLSGASASAATYAFHLDPGTATAVADYGTAPTFTNGVIYDALTGMVTVPAGVTGFAVNVPTVVDHLYEPGAAETLGLTVGTVTVSGAILDTDVAPTIASVTPASAQEGNTLVFNVTLSSGSTGTTTYAFHLDPGTATAGMDYDTTPTFTHGVTYDALTGMITVPAGVTGFAVNVPTISDHTYEPGPNETLSLTIGTTTVGGSIIDNTVALNLFNTGVDDSQHALAMGTHDAHYSLVQVPTNALNLVDNVATELVGAWISNDTNSTWIGQSSDASPIPEGIYGWQTSFTVPTNASLDTLNISFDLWADNRLVDIIVNGKSTGITFSNVDQYAGAGQHIVLTDLNTGGALKEGTNTIEFQIQNHSHLEDTEAYSGPTGLRIDNMHATVEVVPTTPLAALSALDVLGSPDIVFGASTSDTSSIATDANAHALSNEMLNILKQALMNP
jgi:hypothetical protein